MRWASRWYRVAVRQLPPIRRRKRRRLQFDALEAREVPHIHGTVFFDLDMDGTLDPEDLGAEGVTVTATDSAGATQTATTGLDGTYEFVSDAAVRIEFSGFPQGTMPGRVGGTSGGTVRFLAASTDDREGIDLALTQPMLVTSQFYYDHAITGANVDAPAVMAVPYGDENNPVPVVLATFGQVGSVWGLTFQPSSNSVYASSFVKRHAGLGPNATGTATTTGGIYRINRAADPIEVSLLIDLNAVGFSAGDDPHPAVPEFELSGDEEIDWLHDADTLPLVGKLGMGGMQISPDGRTLYVMNLLSKRLIGIPLNPDGTRDTSRSISNVLIPITNPAGSGIAAANFTSVDMRPFAVAVKDNAVFVGVTYTAEASGRTADLRAFVYAFDPVLGQFRSYNQATGAFTTGTAPVLIADLTYTRGVADDPDFTPDTGDEISANWRPWTAAFDTATGQEGVPVHPEPWLTDIVFDGNAMVLGLRDRAGDQAGFETGNADADDDFSAYTQIAVGDILRAAPSGAGWVMESNGASGGVTTGGTENAEGPGNGEFYFEDNVDPFPAEVVTGGLAQVPGFQTIAATGNDPVNVFAGGIYTFLNSDNDPGATNTAGTAFSRTELYISDSINTFGSANGLGDLEAVAAVGGVQVGDRVFVDTNSNGLQDVGELGLSGVVLRLFRAGAQVDSVTSGAGGDFVFNDLVANTAYEIRIDTTQAALTGRTLATANQGANDELDSDATANGNTATIAFTTGAEASTNTSLDVGFSAAAPSLTLGNLVYRDVDNDGLFNTGDTGIDGVLVELLNSSGAPIAGRTATTSGGGLYTFTGLAAGTYMVRLAASNFNNGAVLAGFTSSGTSSADPNDNENNDDNGIVSGQLGNGGVIGSGPITLASGSEPDDDGDASTDTNLSLDFGVVPPPALTLGNLVWNDLDNDASFDTGEAGINGVVVELLNALGTVVDTETTANGGLFTFTGLSAGDYRVRLAASNFQTGGALFNFTSTTDTASDPDGNVDNNDDGAVVGTLGSTGVIQSELITLSATNEPINDGDNDANTNLSLDFGVTAVVANTLTLGDRVYRDTDGDGQFDTGEAGIAGVSVQLLSSTGALIQTVTTDANGLYSFLNLAPNDYRVRLPASNFNAGAVLANFTASTTFDADPDNNEDNDSNGVTSGALGNGGFVESGLITLTAASEPTTDGDNNTNTNLSLDFGLVPPAATTLSLGSTVFIDANGNGLFDTGELPMQGVSVQLVRPDGTIAQTHTTDATGSYTFTGVAPGNYRVRLATTNFQGAGVLVGFTSSTGTNGATTGAFESPPDPDNNTDNDDNGRVVGTLGQTGGAIESDLITLALGTEPTTDGDTDANTNLSLDFGVFRRFSIGNVVFRDTNNNGTHDPSESGIGNVSVRLLNVDLANAVVGTVMTNSTGQYLFSNLVPGNYIVELAASNFNAGGPLFSYQSSTGTSNAFEPAPATAVDKQDHGSTFNVLGSGGTIRSGTVTLGPTANAPTGESPNTDATTPDNQSNLRIDFGVFQVTPTTASISGRVFLDYNNSGAFNGPDTGMQGVTLTLSGGTLGTPLTIQTDASGNFGFSNLQAGTYTLVQTQPATPNNQSGKITQGTAGGSVNLATNTISNIVLTANRQATGYNFAEVPLLTTGGSVYEDLDGDGVKDEGEPGIPGVTITLTGTSVVTGAITAQTEVTDANGSYTFDNLTPGTYTIAETQPGDYVDGKEQNGTPAATVSNDRFANINLATTAAASGGFNFGEVKGATIAGVVYDDVNDDGAQAATGELGIPGATIRLQGINDLGQTINTTQATGANGAFSFTGLRPSTYRLTETQPAGYRDGKDTAPTGGGNATAVNDQISNIVLASSASATGYLFGEHAAADVVISQSPMSTSVAVGGNVTITYTVRNNGTAAATAVSALLNFGGLTFVSSTSTDFNDTTRTWTVGDLAADASETITVTYRAATAQMYTPSAQVSTTSTEISTTNNSSQSTVLAGVTPVPVPVFTPIKPVNTRWWFLSSCTNAFRRLRF